MRVAGLDVPEHAAQEIAVPRGKPRVAERLQDGLVVLVHQHHHPLPGLAVQGPDQVAEALRHCVVAPLHRGPTLNGVELLHQVRVQAAGLAEAAAAEIEAHHRIPDRPVPPVVDGEPFEQCLAALEQLLERVQEQALAEPPRAGEEVVLASVEQLLDEGRLVHVVAAVLPHLAEGLNADGQSAPGHAHTLAQLLHSWRWTAAISPWVR